jgi:transcriptional regulator with XRE-family HTH domain
MPKLLLRTYREKRKLSQGQLATVCKIPQAIISQIETEYIKNPGVFTVAKLARGLKCTVDDLIDENGREDGNQ